MSARFLCSVHLVEYESVPRSDCKPENLEFANLPTCPVCHWIEYRALRDELDSLRKQRDCLLLAIELKKHHLIVPL